MGLQFLAVTLFVAFSFMSQASAITQDTLANACFPTESLEFCENILNSDPRTSSADLPLLSLISIELTQKQATENDQSFSQLRENATSSSVKDSLSNCVGMYEEMIDMIKQAYQLSQEKKYKDIGQLKEAEDLAIKCENAVPSWYNATMAISQTMILTFQTSMAVNAFIVQ